MKPLILSLLLTIQLIGYSQTPTTVSNGNPLASLLNKGRERVDSGLIIPRFVDTTAANQSLWTDTSSAKMIFTFSDSTVWIRQTRYSRWTQVGKPAKFTQDVTVNLGGGKTVGKYPTGTTIPATGKSLDQFLTDISIETIHPTYYTPTLSVSGSPSPGTYEIGTSLTITLSHTYTQNDGGTESSVVYQKNGTNLGSNTDVITLTSNTNYTVSDAYSQGACKVNNVGATDCIGRINSGTLSSGAMYYNVSPSRYWGRSSTSIPNSTTVVSSTGGGNELSGSQQKSNIVVTASGSNYVYFGYASSLPDLTSIAIGGFESIGSFTQRIVSVTNAQGYTQNYKVYVSNNTFSGDTPNIITQ